MKKMADNEEKERLYASDGAETWVQLLKNTALFDEENEKPILKSHESNYRKKPEENRQQDLFLAPFIADISHKDDYGIMDINPFSLGKKPRFTPIKYDLPDADIVIAGSTEYGMATIYDYDIIIFMISHLTRQMNELKYKINNGEKDLELPARSMNVQAADILTQLQQGSGGRQHKALLGKLRRLKGTNIDITKKGKSKRRTGSFSLVGDFQVTSDTKTGYISEVIIEIPRWIYDGVVRRDDPTVLTLNPDYMLLKSGYHKFLSRYARKAAGLGEWTRSLEDIYNRSGTEQPYKKFKNDMRKAVEKLKTDPLPDYDVLWIEHPKKGRKIPIDLVFKRRKKSP